MQFHRSNKHQKNQSDLGIAFAHVYANTPASAYLSLSLFLPLTDGVSVDLIFPSKMFEYCVFHGCSIVIRCEKQNAFATKARHILIYSTLFSQTREIPHVLNTIFCSFFMLYDRDTPELTKDCVKCNAEMKSKERESEALNSRAIG